jgi:hypothetical protein
MAKNGITNSDKMLQTVLCDQKLSAYGEYNPIDYDTIEEALKSENAIVVAVAKVIQGLQRNSSEKEIYNEVSNYLKINLV